MGKTSVVFIVRVGEFFLIAKGNKVGDSLYQKYHFPGGKVERGELIPEALRREAKEELHIDILEWQHLGCSVTPKDTILCWFLITDFKGCPVADSDISDLRKATTKEILSDSEIRSRLPHFITDFLEKDNATNHI